MTAPFLTHRAFKEAMREFFARPAELIFGEETAEAAFSRFSTTIDHLLGEHADRNLLVVTHGTVMSLYLSHWAAIDPYPLWEELGLLSFAIMDRASYSDSLLKLR